MTQLSVALGTYPHTQALKDGSVTPEGFELEFVELGGPIIGAFRRMVRQPQRLAIWDAAKIALYSVSLTPVG